MTQTNFDNFRNDSNDSNDSDESQKLDGWKAAIGKIREHYDDSYGDRVEFAGDVRRAIDGTIPQQLADEGVTQPILRYQQIDPEDARNQIEKRADDDADAIMRAIIEYAGTLDEDSDGSGDSDEESEVSAESATDSDEIPGPIGKTSTIPGGFEFQVVYENPEIEENSPEPVGSVYYWERDENARVGVYENAEYADDGYPYTTAKFVNPVDGQPYWKHTHIAETWVAALEAAEHKAEHRVFIEESEGGENFNQWTARTGGVDPVTIDREGQQYELPRSVGSWDYCEPSDDPTAAPWHGPTTVAIYELGWGGGDDVIQLKGRGTNYRIFYYPGGDDGERRTVSPPITLGEQVRRLRQFLTGDRELPGDSSEPDETSEEDDDWPDFDDYGPTSRRPLPESEAATMLTEGADKRQLPGTGLAPEDFEPVHPWLSGPEATRRVAAGREWPPAHPDDEHRESHYPDAEEEAIGADLAEQLADEPDGAGNTTRAVADGGQTVEDKADIGDELTEAAGFNLVNVEKRDSGAPVPDASEDVEINRWSKKGDRLYINDGAELEQFGTWINLETAEVEDFPGEADLSLEGDELTAGLELPDAGTCWAFTVDLRSDGEPYVVGDSLPSNETVRLIKGISGVMHTPRIIEGETSSSGKTISVEVRGRNYRLDAREIFDGEREYRKSTSFGLYTPGRLRSKQRSNKAPGPQAGANEVTDADELPEPTHWPDNDEPENAPDECPECGESSAPWNDVGKPRCERCGETIYPDEMDERDDSDDNDDSDEREGRQEREEVAPIADGGDAQSDTDDETDTEAEAADTDGNGESGANAYHPTDEYDELEEPSELSGWGGGRRKTLDAIEAKGRLDDVQTFGSIDEMANAVREMSLAKRDGRIYRGIPEKAVDRLESVYESLPEDAKKEFLNDHILHRRINAARKAFNRWLGKLKRREKMPSPVEAGPANYPAEKARKTSRYAREGSEELNERIDKIRAGVNGARQRALNAIGSSVAEQNEKKAQSRAEKVKDQLEPGDIVFYRSTSYGLAPWGVKRLNDKSVRLKRPHQSAGMEKPFSDGETYPEYDLTTVDYDSQFLELTGRDEWEDVDSDESGADVDEELTQGYEAAIRYLMGGEWVNENLEHEIATPAAGGAD